MAGTTTRKAKLALDPRSEEGEREKKEKYHNNLDAALGDSRQTNTGRRDRATKTTAL